MGTRREDDDLDKEVAQHLRVEEEPLDDGSDLGYHWFQTQ